MGVGEGRGAVAGLWRAAQVEVRGTGEGAKVGAAGGVATVARAGMEGLEVMEAEKALRGCKAGGELVSMT